MLDAIEAAFGSSELQGFLAQSHVAVVPCIQRSDDLDLTRLTLREEFAKLDARLGLAAEIEEAAEDIASLSDETLTWRLKEAASAQESATLSVHKDTAEYDLAENGARINRDERRAFEALMTQITRVKSS